MPVRSFEAVDLVGLPKLDSRSLVALSSGLDAAAPEKDEHKKPFRATLPEPVQEALADMGTACDTLTIEIEREPPPPPGAREADRREDTAALALVDLLAAWARLAGEIPQGDAAAEVFERLFGDGSTAFINFPVKKEWAVVEGKLQVITDEKLDDVLKKLGAAPVLEHLRTVHEAYGKAIGTTKAVAPVESPQLREKREELAETVRMYVVRVVGLRDKKKPETAKLVDRLLQPLTAWQPARTSAKSAAPVPAEPAAPAEPVVPKGG